MGSLLFNAALLGGGFVLGRVPLLPLASQVLDELSALSTARKAVMATLVALLVALYVLGILLPLHWVASQEAQKAARLRQVEPTSFRRELRRRGSYSMSYVTDIKAHVFSRC
ncbi:uncharacterized protein PITG_07263 [Phytophthora infestans T30-4]|uniref:Uncharacterized protein n=2 Tax=Phytophthora infestans TaxID=4787 RepID=D0N7N4_PHYIT|nr:uncharacterized protein PITG_07263 [Phytophthora infestans T30-4]EEY53583.1 conserved hypothetical protein [Phytophthora infestans T30-4]KAF4038022.1 hypothetical protein GN244_ATG09796 [Phytophthora infestans]KAF4140719.1 hypothetical protein GN958_ATG10082 [Phytophthora infestans]KAI9999041.1 hypothetical protein PInf_003720 [Phytophthora infestans]|eukprot:XP_002905201.1 conserved hypothetical protein [Phytophthora infestans T30-4]